MIVLLRSDSNNQPVCLTKQIANSGEGEVWETNLTGYLAKIYHDPTPTRIEKLKVMLANPPADPMLNYNHVSIAWLSDLLKDSTGKYLGFLMPAIRDSKQLSSIYNPRRRKKVAPGFNWYYLHVTALNTAWIIQEIHAKDYVLGDIKLENILVNDRAMVAVIDTDSFQVRDSQSNKVYRCSVGSEGFTPVELLGEDFATTNQTEIHDRFRLGVLIHYLLFGYHPFSGQWTGAGDSPEQTELIRQGYWYGAHNSLINESITTIPLDVVHPELKKLFLQCFNDGHTQPHLRPTAQDWHNALEQAVNQLTVCSSLDSHHYSRHYGKCYWCERAAILGVDIFPPASSTAKIPSTSAHTISSPKSSNQTSKKANSSCLNNSPSTEGNSVGPPKFSSVSKTSSSKKSPTKKVSTNNSSVKSSNSGLLNREKISPIKTFFWKRRKFLKIAGVSGLVLATGRSTDDMLHTHSREILKTQVLKFEFEVVKVNYRGQEIERKKHKAEYFRENLGNGISLDMVSLPGGSFWMGSPDTEKKSSWSQGIEIPQHKVTVQPFFMGKFPITQKQWRAISSLPGVHQKIKSHPSKFKGDDLPVERVSWDDAVEFCARLSKQTGKQYRLPTEAEWEYACREGTTTPFHFGETISTDLANYRGTDWQHAGNVYPGNYGSGSKGIYREQTTPVGYFKVANAFGLSDMHGNVWEWCEDDWHPSYKSAPNDGSAWLSGESSNKVIRGGSWYDDPPYCRSACRFDLPRVGRDSSVGVRVVCVVSESVNDSE